MDALPPEPVGVLLTGANGFLGRFLLLELLRRIASKCARAAPLPSSLLPLPLRCAVMQHGAQHCQASSVPGGKPDAA